MTVNAYMNTTSALTDMFSEMRESRFFLLVCTWILLKSFHDFWNGNKRDRSAVYACIDITTNFFPFMRVIGSVLSTAVALCFEKNETIWKMCCNCFGLRFSMFCRDIERNLPILWFWEGQLHQHSIHILTTTRFCSGTYRNGVGV